MWMRVCALVGIGALVACGGGDDDDAVDAALPIDAPAPDVSPAACHDVGPAATGTNAGFQPPSGTLQAWEEVGGVWELLGPAELSCLCGGGQDAPTAVPVTLSGETRDFQTDDIYDNVDLAVFAQGDAPTGTPIATTTSSERGAYTLALPAGTGRIAIRQTDPEGGRFLESVLNDHRLDPTATNQTLDLQQMSYLTANALPAFIGVMRTEGLGLMTGTVVDCNGDHVAGAIATVSATSRAADHLSGADTYYFSAGSTSLPVRHSQASSTNSDGLFVVIELPPTEVAYVQAWGYPDGQSPGVDPLVLLSEVRVRVAADAWDQVVLEPRRR